MDFSRPSGEPALIPANSIGWRVFKNPLALFIGGVAAVILELGEPRVRAGVWDHSSFRTDPLDRLRRTGLAAMVTVYAARSVAEEMIAGVCRIHDRVRGRTETGTDYAASDPELLDWVHATASFGFLEAYRTYVHAVPRSERDLFYSEAVPAARLYAALGAPSDEADMLAQLNRMQPRLERSPVIFEFLEIMRNAAIMPRPLRPLQRLLVRAAVNIVPRPTRDLLALDRSWDLTALERALVRRAGSLADRVRLESSPAALSCVRLGLPADYLWKTSPTVP